MGSTICDIWLYTNDKMIYWQLVGHKITISFFHLEAVTNFHEESLFLFIDITNGKLLFISIILSCLATEWREWTQEYHQYASGPWNVPHNLIYPQKP